MTRTTILAALVLLTAAPRTQAQPPRIDSLAAIASALGAQREFERIRLQYMPYGSAGSGSACSEFIGRFCYTYDNRSGKSPPPPEEASPVKLARTHLVRKLDSLRRISTPGEWLTGTLVHYRLEAGEGEIALRDLADCDATGWWCMALRGMVHHLDGRHREAERAFTEARTMMHVATLCEWDNIADLLPDADSRAYKSLMCDERLELSRKAWWLAQPLYSEPGNHRRSEHDTRRVMERLSRTGMNPTWLRWGDDMSEIVIRFGWPDYWRRYWTSMGDPNATSPRISQFTLEPSYHFIPAMRAIRTPGTASESDWNLLPKDSREEYGPDSLIFGKLSHQTARFLRGDSLLVVSRVSVRDDSLLTEEESLNVGIAMVRAPEIAPLLFFSRTAASEFALTARVPGNDWVASIEVLSGNGRVARSRFGTPAIRPDARGKAISDFLLFRGAAPERPTLEGVLDSAVSSVSIKKGGAIGVFWETYGLARNDQVAVQLIAEPDEQPFLRRVGAALRLVQRPQTASVQWTESEDRAGSTARAVALSLATLRPGWYTLRLNVRINDAAPLGVSRRIEIAG